MACHWSRSDERRSHPNRSNHCPPNSPQIHPTTTSPTTNLIDCQAPSCSPKTDRLMPPPARRNDARTPHHHCHLPNTTRPRTNRLRPSPHGAPDYTHHHPQKSRHLPDFPKHQNAERTPHLGNRHPPNPPQSFLTNPVPQPVRFGGHQSSCSRGIHCPIVRPVN